MPFETEKNDALATLEKRAFRNSIKSGVKKGALYSLLPIIAIDGNPATRMASGLFLGIGIGLFLEYSWNYKPNMTHHKILKKRLGKKYEEDVDEALSVLGLEKMLQQMWFVGKYKEHWEI